MTHMKIHRLVLYLFLLGLSFVFAQRLPLVRGNATHPSDVELIHVFEQQEPEFTKLVEMSKVDWKVIKISPTVTWLDNDISWPRSVSALGFSEERWDEYRQLFRKINLNYGLLRPLDTDVIYLIASFKGSVTSGSEKGYAYSTHQLSPLCESLDQIPQSAGNERFVYKKIKNNWYLYYYRPQ